MEIADMWFKLGGDSRLGRCDSEGCGGQPTWRLEASGVGSNYCSGCQERIEAATLGMSPDEWQREKAMAEFMASDPDRRT
jgi:hypothetical protein